MRSSDLNARMSVRYNHMYSPIYIPTNHWLSGSCSENIVIVATISAQPMSALSSQQRSAKCRTIQLSMGIGVRFASKAISVFWLPSLHSLILPGLGKNQSSGLLAAFRLLESTSTGNVHTMCLPWLISESVLTYYSIDIGTPMERPTRRSVLRKRSTCILVLSLLRRTPTENRNLPISHHLWGLSRTGRRRVSLSTLSSLL